MIVMPSSTEKRIWFALAAPAVAWSVQELASALVGHAACAEHAAGAGRAIMIVISVVALALSVAAIAVGYGRFRALAGEAGALEGQRERQQMMALAGALVGVVFTLGVVWAALPSLVISSVCGSKR